MAASNFDGPLYAYGNMAGIPLGYGAAVPDPNLDASPSLFFQGTGILDVRYPFMKDKVQGYTGMVPGHADHVSFVHVEQIPAALGSALVAPLQTVAANVPMALATAQAVGASPGVPIRPATQPFNLNGGAVTTVVALDFGFAFGNFTAGNATVTVADSTQVVAGMPLVCAGVGAGATSLLTNCASIVDATHITVGPNLPATTNAAAPIGTGNMWGPSPNGYPVPDAAFPYFAGGPGLFLDPRQAVERCLSVTGVAGGTGGTVRVTGYDFFGQLQTQNIVVAAGSNTVFSTKTFKYVLSAVPLFTDATHNYSVGTGDTFGFALRTDQIEYLSMWWNATQNAPTVAVASGWLTADTTSPATPTTGDVRGTWQVSASGAGTVWVQALGGPAASNGTVSGLAMSGRRLVLFSTARLFNTLNTFPSSPQFTYGVVPA